MRYRLHTLDVFTDRVFGGNPLAVFPDARGLTDAQMPMVARELNLSETVFVFPPGTPTGTRRLRIFTPGSELPFAGHPTLGAAILLAALGEVALAGEETRIVLEEGVGPVPVTIRARDGRPTFAQLTAAQPVELGPEPPPAVEVAAMLSLASADLHTDDWRPVAASAGVPFFFVPVRDTVALGRVRMDVGRWDTTLARWWAPHVCPFVPTRDGEPFRMRMFAPAMGIPEDPATGAAATAFAGYLAERSGRTDGTLAWTVEQGVEMGRPSRLFIEADRAGGRTTAVRVGGTAVVVGNGEMEIPTA